MGFLGNTQPQLIAVDTGRSWTKVYCNGRKFSFPSLVSKWRHRNNKQELPGDIELEYQWKGDGEPKKYFVGQLARREGEYARSMFTDTKAKDETLLLTLAAISEAGMSGDLTLVTGVPVDMYTEKEKKALRELLQGYHSYKVNGIMKQVNITKVIITLECGAALFAHDGDKMGTVRFLDIGARTTNYVTYVDKVYIDRESGTINRGWETVKDPDLEEMADAIAGQVAKNWNESDKVFILGGRAEEIVPYYQVHFPNTSAMSDPQFKNVMGYWAAGLYTLQKSAKASAR